MKKKHRDLKESIRMRKIKKRSELAEDGKRTVTD